MSDELMNAVIEGEEKDLKFYPVLPPVIDVNNLIRETKDDKGKVIPPEVKVDEIIKGWPKPDTIPFDEADPELHYTAFVDTLEMAGKAYVAGVIFEGLGAQYMYYLGEWLSKLKKQLAPKKKWMAWYTSKKLNHDKVAKALRIYARVKAANNGSVAALLGMSARKVYDLYVKGDKQDEALGRNPTTEERQAGKKKKGVVDKARTLLKTHGDDSRVNRKGEVVDDPKPNSEKQGFSGDEMGTLRQLSNGVKEWVDPDGYTFILDIVSTNKILELVNKARVIAKAKAAALAAALANKEKGKDKATDNKSPQDRVKAARAAKEADLAAKVAAIRREAEKAEEEE